MRRVFADTSYFIAIIAPNDQFQQIAKAWGAEPFELVTTAWVMAEMAAYLSSPANRPLFTKLLETLRGNPLVTFISASSELFDSGAELYAKRSDKSWSLVDCISFIVMQRENLTEALSGDHHFMQAGFKALLMESTGGGQ